MTQIIIGTTPTITYKFKIVSPAELEKAILTIKIAGSVILEKTLADATVGEDSLSWTLTQQETLSIGTRSGKMMLTYCFESSCIPSVLAKCRKNDLAVVDTEGQEKAVRNAVSRGVYVYGYLNVGAHEKERSYYDKLKHLRLAKYEGWDGVGIKLISV